MRPRPRSRIAPMRRPRLLAAAGAALAVLALTALPAAGAGIRLVHFRSPSGNINCLMATGGGAPTVSCLVRQNTWPRLPRRPASCDLDWAPAELELFGT